MSDRDAPGVAAAPPVTAMTLVALDLPHPSPSIADGRPATELDGPSRVPSTDGFGDDGMTAPADVADARQALELERQIAVVRRRAASAAARGDARRQAIEAAVRPDIAAAATTLAELDRRHDATLAQIREAARVEIDGVEAAAARATGDVDVDVDEAGVDRAR